ncbi:Holliday junction resolvase RuvX [Pajaroellobacter abortibovis]|uniref:Putative pre-16S rRNA nuclease n=1 Tax=Pajaroellobacter abortibovis TaxID=1882918 RepID=A0A1L6MWZ9_9BACT|nr:Holliday junction resolvase RuvX [Pajaroellobacter abortibovis]APS00073.1 hypothetical protein BCY86_04805 [Pajaroellobacter abortibovis]
MKGRTCALDISRTRVGVAVDDELRLFAHPRGTLNGRNQTLLLRQLQELVTREGITRFVIGLPLDMHGGEGDTARWVRRLAQAIQHATSTEVVLWDERWTTVEAKRRMQQTETPKRQHHAHTSIDEVAAVIILEAWLEANKAVEQL